MNRRMPLVTAERKVKGGKLFRIRVAVEGGRPESLRLTGDFFLFPEGAMSRLEEALLIDLASGAYATRTRALLESGELVLVGIGLSDLEDALMEVRRRSGA